MIRRGVTAVVFRKERGKKKYLLLKRKLNWKGWELPKGGCKFLEREDKCLVREIKEELGVDRLIFEGTDLINKFMYERLFRKDNKWYTGARNSVYSVEVFSTKIKFDREEHSGFKWVSKKEALRLLTWEDQKRVFKKLTR